MEIQTSWDFEKIQLEWIKQVKKIYPTLKIQNLRNNFSYPLNCQWPKTSTIEQISTDGTKLLVFADKLNPSEVKKYNAIGVLNNKKLNSYIGRGDAYHTQGLDEKWELAFILLDVINAWRVNKLNKKINIVCSVNENLFFEQVKFLSIKNLMQKTLSILKVNADVEITALASEHLMAGVDYKNNVIRLTYAVLAAILSGADFVAVRPLVGFSQNYSWQLACQTFNVISLETDIATQINPQQGATFFEPAVEDFSTQVWEALQQLLKITDNKKLVVFTNELIDTNLMSQKKNLLNLKRKVVGLNEFIAPNADKANNTKKTDLKVIEEKRKKYNKFSKKNLSHGGFYYLGDKSKNIKSLNAISQFFALGDVVVEWEPWDEKNSKNKKFLVLVKEVGIEQQFPEKNLKNKLVVSNQKMENCFFYDAEQSPFELWDKMIERYS